MKRRLFYSHYFVAATVMILSLSLLLTACKAASSANTSQKDGQASFAASTSAVTKSNASVSSVSNASASLNAENSRSEAVLDNGSNIKDIKGFVPVENQCFPVDLNSWGSVNFISGKITGGAHVPTVFYLTNESEDILYRFSDSPFPYNVDVSAVSFKDVNKDGLKDIIIIVADNSNAGKPIAAVWLQGKDKKFVCNLDLFHSLNESGYNKNIEAVVNFLSTKF